jgi:hypothetical protein
MIVLQILMVPGVALLLLIGIFVIGSSGLDQHAFPPQVDPSIRKLDEPDLIRMNTQHGLLSRSDNEKTLDEVKVNENPGLVFPYQSSSRIAR